MTSLLITNYFCPLKLCAITKAQAIDSTLNNLQQIPSRYSNGIDKEINQYCNCIASKTEKTLTKLRRGENKTKPQLPQAFSETVEKLFGEEKITFSNLLQPLKQVEAFAPRYQSSYNKYSDDIISSPGYLIQQKAQPDNGFIQKVMATNDKCRARLKLKTKRKPINNLLKNGKKN